MTCISLTAFEHTFHRIPFCLTRAFSCSGLSLPLVALACESDDDEDDDNIEASASNANDKERAESSPNTSDRISN